MSIWEIVWMVLGILAIKVIITAVLESQGATPFLAQRTSGNRARLLRAKTLKEVDYCRDLIHGGPSHAELAQAHSNIMLRNLEKCAFNGDSDGVKKIYREWSWLTRSNPTVNQEDIESVCKQYLTQARSVRSLEPNGIHYSDEIPWGDDGTWKQGRGK